MTDAEALDSEYLMRVDTLTTWNENVSESPLLEVGQGLFSEESLMSVATDTTRHEKDGGFSTAPRLVAGAGEWIPAFAGMTIGGVVWAVLRVMQVWRICVGYERD